MKRIAAFVLMMLFLPLCAFQAAAEVYVDADLPEDWNSRDLLRLTVFRTGEGDAMLLQAGGESMMIDGGPFKFREKLRDALKERHIEHFKYLFSTHPHDDHIDGLRMLMYYGFTDYEILSPFPQNYNDDHQKSAVKQQTKSGIPYRQLKDGDKLTLGEAEITIHVWDQGSINARSAMARVTYRGSSLLLCADIIGDTQHYFLEHLPAEELKADVVKAPHHGLTPFVKDFLTAIDPGFIIITNYTYTGKTGKTVGQAKSRSIPYKHSGDGTVIAESDGTDWYVRQTLKQF